MADDKKVATGIENQDPAALGHEDVDQFAMTRQAEAATTADQGKADDSSQAQVDAANEASIVQNQDAATQSLREDVQAQAIEQNAAAADEDNAPKSEREEVMALREQPSFQAAPASSGVIRDFIPAGEEPTLLESQRLQFTFSTPRKDIGQDFIPPEGWEPVHVPTVQEATDEAQRAEAERAKVAQADRADEIAGQLGSLNEVDAAMVVRDMVPHDKAIARKVESEGRNRKAVLKAAGDGDPDVEAAVDEAREARDGPTPAEEEAAPADEAVDVRDMSIEESQASAWMLPVPAQTGVEVTAEPSKDGE